MNESFEKAIQSFPSPLQRALTANDYTKGDSEFSVTQLISPPQRSLLRLHHEAITTHHSAFYATLGTILHRLLEDYADEAQGEFAERRIFTTVHGRKVSGQVDLYEQGTRCVSDWKFVGGVQEQTKDEHHKQLQMNGYLAELNGWEVEHVAIVYFQRDWKILQAILNKGYPQQGIRTFIHPYDRAYAKSLFESTVAEHAAAVDGSPRDCTTEEKWQTADTYALMKPGAARATKLCSSLAEAESEQKPGQVIQVRKGTRTYCEHFCGFKHVCPQYQRESLAQPSLLNE